MEVTTANDVIEQQLFKLMRRSNAIHVTTSRGEVELERSSYGILCLIADEGPQRLGAIAQSFHLDPSTVTRQAQAVVRLGLARKERDPLDGRATLLDLTELGHDSIRAARGVRRQSLDLLLRSWDPADLDTLGRLLTKFNCTLDNWETSEAADLVIQHGLHEPGSKA